jgi:ATP-dependent Clp protease ATP-binding subunit ClpC
VTAQRTLLSSVRRESEIERLYKQAEALAGSRKERATTAHLLVVLSLESNPAAELLRQRRLSSDTLLPALRVATDDDAGALARSLTKAKEVAERMRAPEASAIHLLIALLGDRGFAAYRVLDQSGLDISRLRVASMNAGLGELGRQPIVTRREHGESSQISTPPRPSTTRGTAVAWIPKPKLLSLEPPSLEELGELGATDEVGIPPSLAPLPSSKTPAPKVKVVPLTEPPKGLKRRAKSQGSRFALSSKKYPTLTSLGQNLTLRAERGELDPVFGRDLEIEQTLDVLAKRQANNPCLVGEAGVGKSSVVRGLALRVAQGQDVDALDDRIIIEIAVSDLIAGTAVRGALAQRLAAVRKEVLASEGRIVLFLDEVHQLFLADGGGEIAAELKLALARGELPCIGATTEEEYKRTVEADPALCRRFTRVDVDEPSREDCFLILEALAPELGRHHGLSFADEALALSVAWSIRYLPGRALPDKAIGLLDLAGARARRRSRAEVQVSDLAEVMAEQAGVPLERLMETDRDRMLRLESLLARRIVGHDDKLGKIAKIIRRNAAGLNGSRPIGTFLLLGPTGVGKTETAKALAAELFASETALTRIDLSEYSESHAVSRLIGAPPGYVGYEAGGQLTEAVRRRPYQVLLLDEIEKAHPEVLETFLALFDEGRLTDGRGRTVDFTNTVIILTSNLGAHEASRGLERRVGFQGQSGNREQELEQKVLAGAKQALAPELYNRLDEVLVFLPLTREHVQSIARRLLDRLAVSLFENHRIRLAVEDEVISHLLENGGYEPELGARPLKRAIARLIEAQLAEKLLAGELRADHAVHISKVRGALSFRASQVN